MLQSKYKKKRCEEQGASGIEVEEPYEKEQIEELSEKEETAAESTGVKNKGDTEAAEDARRKALERFGLGETKKRKKERSRC